MGQTVEEKILDIKVRYEDAIRGIADYSQKLDNLKKNEADLKQKLKENKISREQYNLEMAESKAKSGDCSNAIRVLTRDAQNNLAIQRTQAGSLVSLRAELSNATLAFDSLSKAEREASKGQELKDKINAITKELKSAEEETQRFYRNVGNYTEAMRNAAAANLPFINEIKSSIEAVSSLGNFVSGLKGELSGIVQQYQANAVSASTMSGAQKAAAVTSNLLSSALKVLKLALISTGIGAIVVALGSLIAYLTKTQAGTELLSKGMAAIGAVVNVLVDRLAKLGGALVKLFTGDFMGAANDTKEAFSGIGDEIARETKLAIQLKEVQVDLEKQEIMLSMRRAASRSEIERLKLIADNTTKSLKERIAAAEKAYKMESDMAQKSIELGQQQLANMLGQVTLSEEVKKMLEMVAQGAMTADEVINKLGLSNSTVKDLKEFAQVFNDVAQREAEASTKNKETQNKINAMRKQAVATAKEQANKEREAMRTAEDTLFSLIKDNAAKRREEVKRTYDREIEDLKIKLANEKNLTVKAREEINATIKMLEQKRLQELNALSDEELTKQIAKEQKRIELKLAAVKSGSEQEFQLKMQQLLKNEEAELAAIGDTEKQKKEIQERYANLYAAEKDPIKLAALQESMNAELAAVTENEQTKLLIKEKYNREITKLDEAHRNEVIKKQQESIKIEFETRIAERYKSKDIEMETLQIRLEQKQRELDTLQQMEGESIQAFNLRKLTLQQEHFEAEKAIKEKEVEIELVKYQATADITGALSDLADAASEHSKELAMASKILALAEIAINTGKAIAVGVAQAQSVPFPGNIAAIATTITTVLANIATATKTVKSAKFATGGAVVGSGTGTSDSVPAQLSNGESVLTAMATSMFAPILSSFNMIGGGVPISVTATSGQTIGEDMLARAVAKGYMMAPAPILSVEEFNTVANRTKYVENLGSF